MNKQLLAQFSFASMLTLGVLTQIPQQVKAQQSIINEGEDQVRLFNARQDYLRGDFLAALGKYKAVQSNKPNDAEVAFRVGQCHLAMNNLEPALEMLEKAKSMNPNAHKELNFALGRTYQQLGQHDKALEAFNQYKTAIGDSKDDNNAAFYIAQVTTAKELMAKPVNATVTLLGNTVNSMNNDKAPILSPDTKTLIFTSSREGKADKQGDANELFEDVYISTWDSVKKEWSEAERIRGGINTDKYDAATSITPDGKILYLYLNDTDGPSRGGDIYTSKVNASGKWGTPKPLGKPINTSYWEGGACISPDGKMLFFFSERPGGLGGADIYMSKRISKSEWDTPVNLGPVINTEYDEGGVYMASDNKTLFFSSQGHNSMGSYDVFKTVYENGKWSKPVNLGYPINTIYRDVNFVISQDGKKAFLDSDRIGGAGMRDIYSIDLSAQPLFTPPATPITPPKNKF